MLNPFPKPAASRDESAAHSRRNADAASARLWLAEGFPIADVLTMLEVRRRFELAPHFARGYAAEIILAVCHGINTKVQPQIAHREESHNAIA
jgi:hypothetical protein